MLQTESQVQTSSIRLAIDRQCLENLLSNGLLNIGDFNCLDQSSKDDVWSMLRSLTAKRMLMK